MNNRGKIIGIILIICVVIFLIINLVNQNTEDGTMLNFVGKNYKEAEFFADQYNLDLNITYEESNKYSEDIIISQSIKEGTVIEENQVFEIVVSKTTS